MPFFGFSAAMLGISGFESSANFVEEQQQVFQNVAQHVCNCVSLILRSHYYLYHSSWHK
jgi:hypothetical protein